MAGATFLLSGWHNHKRPFQYVLEGPDKFGEIPTSPVMVLSPLLDDVTIDFQRLIEKYYGDNQYTYYKALDLGNRFQWSAKFAPESITFSQLCIQQPDYADPSDNLANSMTFYRSWDQASGAFTMSEHHQAYQGTKAKSWDCSIALGMVNIGIDFISRQITAPNTTSPLTTPTLKAFSDFTATPLTHVDSGALPMTINAVSYPQDSFHVNVANNFMGGAEGKVYNGSKLIDALQLARQIFTGDVVVPIGKDLNLEGKYDIVALTEVPLVYAVKPAVMTITLTNTKFSAGTITQSAESEDEWKISHTIEATALALS